jgi:flagellar hook assembly protein FlgD
VKVYNTAGEYVRTLLDVSSQSIGSYPVTWDGKNDNKDYVASGIYIISFKEPLGIHFGRVMIVK